MFFDNLTEDITLEQEKNRKLAIKDGYRMDAPNTSLERSSSESRKIMQCLHHVSLSN